MTTTERTPPAPGVDISAAALVPQVLDRLISHGSATSGGRREASLSSAGPPDEEPLPLLARQNSTLRRKTLTREQLDKMVTVCYQLAKHNKLDSKNMWDLQLIDCMPQLVRDRCEEDGVFNFTTVTCGLDASIDIYAKRVDNTHSTAMDSLSRAKKRKPSTVQQGGEEGGEQGETQASRHRSRARMVNDTGFLLPEASVSGEQQVAAMEPRDPLFHNTTAKFDVAGQEGLVTATTWIEDGMYFPVPVTRALVNGIPTNSQWDDDEEVNLDRSILGPQGHNGSTPIVNEMFLEHLEVPMIDHGLRFQIVEEAGETVGHNDTGTTMPAFHSSSPVSTSPVPTSPTVWTRTEDGAPSLFEGGSIHDGDFDVMDGREAGENVAGSKWNANGFHVPWHGTPLSPQRAGEALDENGLRWVLEAGSTRLLPAKKVASHWKFPQQQTVEASKQKKRQPRRRKVIPDYTCLPEIDRNGLAPKKRFQRIDLLTRRPANKLTQEDPYYQEPFMCGLSLRPNDRQGFLPCGLPGVVGGNQAQCSPRDAGLHDFDPDGKDAGPSGTDCDWGDDADDMDAPGGLIDAPARAVAYAPIRVAARMKHVDIGALKENLWQEMCRSAPGEPESSHSSSTFSQIVQSVPEAGPAGRLEDISPHMCFICLLHLANEHGLQLCGRDNLDEVSIVCTTSLH